MSWTGRTGTGSLHLLELPPYVIAIGVCSRWARVLSGSRPGVRTRSGGGGSWSEAAGFMCHRSRTGGGSSRLALHRLQSVKRVKDRMRRQRYQLLTRLYCSFTNPRLGGCYSLVWIPSICPSKGVSTDRRPPRQPTCSLFETAVKPALGDLVRRTAASRHSVRLCWLLDADSGYQTISASVPLQQVLTTNKKPWRVTNVRSIPSRRLLTAMTIACSSTRVRLPRIR